MADKNVKVSLKGVRLSFASLVKPKAMRDDKTKELTGYSFETALLIPKKLEDGTDNPNLTKVREAMKQTLEATWPGQNMKIPPDRRCIKDGEPLDEDSGKRVPLYDGYEGCFALSARQRVDIEEWEKDRKAPVQLLASRKGADGKFPRLSGSEAEKHFYSGAIVDAVVTIYGYDGKGVAGRPNRISASLDAVKFVRHAPAFSGNTPINAEDYFDEEDADDGFDEAPASKPAAASDEDDLLG